MSTLPNSPYGDQPDDPTDSLTQKRVHLRRSLHQIWHHFSLFMVEKSMEELPVGSADGGDRNSSRQYDQMAKFYVYFSPIEEQRDWLERFF